MDLSREQIEQIYSSARDYFVRKHPEWLCTIEQGALVIQLNWQNATYFNGVGVTHVARVYRHVVKVRPDGKFMTLDVHANDENAIGLGGISLSMEAFAGKSWNYNYEKVLGHDNDTGETGVLTYKFNTSDIQKPVKEYFEGQGLKYKFSASLGEGLKAIPAPTKITIGVLFTVIGLVFSLVGYLIFFSNPYQELTVTTNGVTSVMYAYEIPVGVKIGTFAFSAVFLVIGLFMILNFVKYNVRQKEY